MNMNRIQWYGPSLVLIAAVLLSGWLGPRMAREIAWAREDVHIQLARNSLADNLALAELSDAYRQIAQVVEPSVVHIEVLGKNKMFRRDDLYDRYDPNRPAGNGSGWVFDTAGHIITNYHVVKGVDELRVTFFDGSRYEAKVVGFDDRTDVAVLKVEAQNLHPAMLAEKSIETGEIVFAFGSPLDFSFSMSQGIVSAKGRRLNIIGPGGYENFIQTDAAMNPGNSGGPLTNVYGEVIGMNAAIASRSGGSIGIGFAIPIEMIRHTVEQIINTGHVTRGFLGIALPQRDLDPRMAKTFGFEGKGVLVENATPNSPAAKAGILRGDIITHVNDRAMEKISQLRRYIASFAPGTTVAVTLFRPNSEGDPTRTVSVTLAELPTDLTARRRPIEPGLDDDDAIEQDAEAMSLLRKFGIESIVTFDEQIADRLGVKRRAGVLVRSVRSNSRAAPSHKRTRERLHKGMLITRVMDEPVATVEQLLNKLARHDAVEGIRVSIAAWNPQSNQWEPAFWLIQLPKE